MKENINILDKINHTDGLTVPEGYFDSFAERMAASLPTRNEAENPSAVILPPPTLWSRVRPYAYLAAMFAGVWCMLKMFSLMASPSDADAMIDRNPVLAEAIGNDTFINDYILEDINEWDIIDEMIEDGIDASSLNFTSDADSDVIFVDPAAISPAN